MDLDANTKTERALAALRSAGEGGLTKNELAHAIWGIVTPSTQSMTTRVTQALLQAGKISEEPSGRRRIVRLSSVRKTATKVVTERAVEALHDGNWASPKLDEGWQRPFDRPYAQLERATRWVAASLEPERESDQVFAKVLLRVVSYSGDPMSDALDDRRVIEDVIGGWKDEARKVLSRAISIFGVSRERDFIAPMLLEQAKVWTRLHKPEAILWAAMSLAVARRLHLNGGDRAEADIAKLRQAALSVLNAMKATAPIHVTYWLQFDKALRGDFSGLSWDSVRQSSARAPLPRHTGQKLKQAIREDENGVHRDASFNSFFVDVERLIAAPITSEVERRVGFARRFNHGFGASPPSAESWAYDHAPVVREVLYWFWREHRTDPAVARLAKRIEVLKQEAPKAALIVREPTLDIVRYLSASERKRDDVVSQISRRRAEKPLEYAELIRNNFWTPSMLWSDIALSTANS